MVNNDRNSFFLNQLPDFKGVLEFRGDWFLQNDQTGRFFQNFPDDRQVEFFRNGDCKNIPAVCFQEAFQRGINGCRWIFFLPAGGFFRVGIEAAQETDPRVLKQSPGMRGRLFSFLIKA